MPRTKWLYKVDIKQHLGDDGRALEDRALAIEKEFQKKELLNDCVELWDAVDMLKYAGEQDDVEEFDIALEQIYDWADYERVWLGL